MDETEQLTARLFGEILRRKRERIGLSLREAAEKMNLAHGTLDRYELGKRVPSEQAIRAIAKGLSVPYTDLYNLFIDCRADAAIRADKQLAESSKEQMMKFLRWHREEDKKATNKATGDK